MRKTKPKIDAPFKCYIYMTAGDAVYPVTINGAPYTCSNVGGKVVIGEFVCDRIIDIPYSQYFVDYYHTMPQGDLEATCLDMGQIDEYLLSKNGYGWNITNLVIYDKPKELSEFFQYCGDNPKCDGCEALYYSNTECGKEEYCCSIVYGCKPLKRPPQSWCYVVKGAVNESSLL